MGFLSIYLTIVVILVIIIFSLVSILGEKKSPITSLRDKDALEALFMITAIVAFITLIGSGITVLVTTDSVEKGIKTDIVIEDVSYSFIKSVSNPQDLKDSDFDKDLPVINDNRLIITKNNIPVLISNVDKEDLKITKNKEIKVSRIVKITKTMIDSSLMTKPDESESVSYELQIPSAQ